MYILVLKRFAHARACTTYCSILVASNSLTFNRFRCTYACTTFRTSFDLDNSCCTCTCTYVRMHARARGRAALICVYTRARVRGRGAVCTYMYDSRILDIAIDREREHRSRELLSSTSAHAERETYHRACMQHMHRYTLHCSRRGRCLRFPLNGRAHKIMNDRAA